MVLVSLVGSTTAAIIFPSQELSTIPLGWASGPCRSGVLALVGGYDLAIVLGALVDSTLDFASPDRLVFTVAIGVDLVHLIQQVHVTRLAVGVCVVQVD